MPEWNARTRAQAYQFLGEGRLDEAFAFIEPFVKFKAADMKPVDAKALARLDEKLRADGKLQARLCRSAIDNSLPVRKLGLFALGQVAPVDGRHFVDCALELADAIAKRKISDYSNPDSFALIWVGPGKKLAFRETQKELTAEEAIGWMSSHMYFFEPRENKQIQSLAEAICASPSPEGVALLEREYRAPPKPEYRFRVPLETEKLIPKAMINKFEKALAAVDKGRRAPAKIDVEADGRARLHEFMSSGDMDAVKDFIQSLPKMTGAQRKALCENLPPKAIDVLGKNAQLIFDWMQDAGALGQVAAEWADQGKWPEMAGPILKWMIDAAEATKTSYYKNDANWVVWSDTKPPRLIRHLDLLAGHFDSGLVCAIVRAFPKKHETRLYGYMMDELAARLIRQCGFDAAQEKLASIRDGAVEAKIASDCAEYLGALQKSVELVYNISDPMREIVYFPPPLKTATPEEVEGFYEEWMKDKFTFWFSNNELWAIFRDPRYSKKAIACAVDWIQDDDIKRIDHAFKLLMLDPPRVASLGYNLTELTSRALWHVKSSEVNRAIMRLRALASRGLCAPAEAASLVEQTFSGEEPATWRAAAEAIVYLRELDSKIELTTIDRIQEIIARDPAKYGKFLKPLLSSG
ncbi:MAG: hypothetical protein ABFD69_04720 [Candidatus Sumerlaeia bacterium]